ncbi:unnamed protein product [Sphagnum tenellum]
MYLTVSHGEDGAVEDVHGDGPGARGRRLAGVDARVAVVDVADDEAGGGAPAGVLQQERLLGRLRAVERDDLETWLERLGGKASGLAAFTGSERYGVKH